MSTGAALVPPFHHRCHRAVTAHQSSQPLSLLARTSVSSTLSVGSHGECNQGCCLSTIPSQCDATPSFNSPDTRSDSTTTPSSRHRALTHRSPCQTSLHQRSSASLLYAVSTAVSVHPSSSPSDWTRSCPSP
ncbi:hypothetical protein AAHA92_21874 [Salvia divinorum]|uniref:Uncharacterized protein n=1 Tax=Salvia divinorum TaxID=28513 RepID=A0ABD1GLV1_SALDI